MPFKVISESTKVVDFATKRKRVFGFLLVIHSNLCTAAYWSKIANSYLLHPHSTPSLWVTPFEFWDERDIPRNYMMGLPYGEEIMIVGIGASTFGKMRGTNLTIPILIPSSFSSLTPPSYPYPTSNPSPTLPFHFTPSSLPLPQGRASP